MSATDDGTTSANQDREPIFFYGPNNDNGYLSQFYECHFEYNGKEYCNLEQFFQVAKAVQAGDTVTMIDASHFLC